VAFVSQSGAVGTAITALAHEQGIGIGYFVSTGNEADVEFSDLCDRFIDDDRVRVIAGYLESVRDGDRFRRVALRALEAGKPIVLVKVGTTDVGSRAVRSHTGLLAGADAVYEAVFAQTGIVRADGIEHLLDCLKPFVAYPAGVPVRGRRVAVLSHSGGAGVMMGDAAVTHGLAMPQPSPALTGALQQRLPPYAALGNPIDMTANVIFDPGAMAATAQAVAQSGEYDAVMLCVNLIWRQGSALADALAAARAATATPLAVAWIAGPAEPVQRLAAHGVPVFGDAQRCVRAIAARLRWESARLARAADSAGMPGWPGDKPRTASLAPGVRILATYRGQEALLKRHAIPLAPAHLVQDAAQACRAATALGYPVAAKLVSPTLTHKSDIGGVALHLMDEDALRAAVLRLLAIPCVDREGILVQQMVVPDQSVELIVGFNRDPVFGPVLLLGLGGVFVEVIRDVMMRPAPLAHDDALRMIRDARFAALLTGARGRPPCDLDALARLLAAVSVLACSQPAVQALDLNPVLLSPHGAVAVDFRFEIANAAAPRDAIANCEAQEIR
jgi:acetyltransferase